MVGAPKFVGHSMRKCINSKSEALVLSAQRFADWCRILKSPNRAEFILITVLVACLQHLIIYLFNRSGEFLSYLGLTEYLIRLFSMTILLSIEEFIQFSIASRLPIDKLLLNCGKYAFGWWLIEFSAIIPIFIMYVMPHLATKDYIAGFIVLIYIRILGLPVFILATFTRYLSLTKMKKYAILIFLIQLAYHTYWNVDVAFNANTIKLLFEPLFAVEQFITK